METHIHQTFTTSIWTRMASPMSINSWVKKNVPSSQRTFIYPSFGNFSLTTLFLSSLVLTLSSNLWWHLWTQSAISITNIKYTFTHSKQTVSVLDVQEQTVSVWDVQVYFSESRKLKTKLYNFTPTPATQSAVKKVSFIHKYFNATWSCPRTTSFRKNSINNVTCFLLACAYPQHLISENIKNPHLHPQ